MGHAIKRPDNVKEGEYNDPFLYGEVAWPGEKIKAAIYIGILHKKIMLGFTN